MSQASLSRREVLKLAGVATVGGLVGRLFRLASGRRPGRVYAPQSSGVSEG